MIDKDKIKPIVIKAVEDSQFAEELKNDPRATLAKHGFDLTEEEINTIVNAENLEDLTSPVVGGVLF